jgi:hypothetical protein
MQWGSKRSFAVYFSTEGGAFDSTMYAVDDNGFMPDEVMITCTLGYTSGSGTVCMFGGNDTDSYLAGYMIYKNDDQFWFCVQMNANGSDGPIMSDGNWGGDGEIDVCAQYANGYARLYIDGELVAEGERNWVPADGGLVSLMSGSHLADEPKDGKDSGMEGIQWVSDLNICANGGKRFKRFKRVIAKFDDYVDGPELACYDAGEMHDGIIMSCQCNVEAAGTLLHYGGNCDDSYMAGYILYWGADQFIWGIQMNANGSGPAIVVDGYGADEYSVCGTYKNGHAELWLDDELVAEQDTDWCMAEGGVLSLMSGSHLGGKDDAPDGGPNWIADVYIGTI